MAPDGSHEPSSPRRSNDLLDDTRAARCALTVLALTLVPATTRAQPTADWTGELRADLGASAWFDEARTRGFVQVRGHTSRVYRAWKAHAVDLDGDGTREIVLGIWSSQRRHDEPDPHRTIWVLRWDDDRQELVEAWRGSALARPLVDFDVNVRHVVAYERVADDCFQTEYAWTGFGFRGINSHSRPCDSP